MVVGEDNKQKLDVLFQASRYLMNTRVLTLALLLTVAVLVLVVYAACRHAVCSTGQNTMSLELGHKWWFYSKNPPSPSEIEEKVKYYLKYVEKKAEYIIENVSRLIRERVIEAEKFRIRHSHTNITHCVVRTDISEVIKSRLELVRSIIRTRVLNVTHSVLRLVESVLNASEILLENTTIYCNKCVVLGKVRCIHNCSFVLFNCNCTCMNITECNACKFNSTVATHVLNLTVVSPGAYVSIYKITGHGIVLLNLTVITPGTTLSLSINKTWHDKYMVLVIDNKAVNLTVEHLVTWLSRGIHRVMLLHGVVLKNMLLHANSTEIENVKLLPNATVVVTVDAPSGTCSAVVLMNFTRSVASVVVQYPNGTKTSLTPCTTPPCPCMSWLWIPDNRTVIAYVLHSSPVTVMFIPGAEWTLPGLIILLLILVLAIAVITCFALKRRRIIGAIVG